MGRSKRDSGNWLTTYSDLVTLLMVFFILLYVLTPGIDQSTFDNFISYFQNSVGVIDQSSLMSQQSKEEYKVEVMERWEVVEDFLEKHGLSEQAEITPIPEGVKITLSDSLTFNSGSDRLLPAAEMVLEEVAGVLDEEVGETESQGHTDNVPISNVRFRSNWHLGAARAVTTIQFVQERSGLEPTKFIATSYGEYRPVTSNETEAGRRQNRRVEIYVRYELLMNTFDLDSLIQELPDLSQFEETI